MQFLIVVINGKLQNLKGIHDYVAVQLNVRNKS